MPQVDVDPLFVRVRSINRALLGHLLPAANTRDLLTQVRGGHVRGQRWIWLKHRCLGGIPEPRPEGQGDQPTPAKEAERRQDPPRAPLITKREDVEAEDDQT